MTKYILAVALSLLSVLATDKVYKLVSPPLAGPVAIVVFVAIVGLIYILLRSPRKKNSSIIQSDHH